MHLVNHTILSVIFKKKKNQNWLGIFVIDLYLEKQTFFTQQLLAQEGVLGKEGESNRMGKAQSQETLC